MDPLKRGREALNKGREAFHSEVEFESAEKFPIEDAFQPSAHEGRTREGEAEGEEAAEVLPITTVFTPGME